MSEIIFNIHTLNTVLITNPERFKKVYILKKKYSMRLKKLILSIQHHNIPIQISSLEWMNNQLKSPSHHGIFAYVKSNHNYKEEDLIYILKNTQKPLFLILDNITDPHNLGACLRTAEAVGVHAVIIPKNNSAKLNSTVIKVSCGASECIPLIRVTNLARTLRLLQEHNIWILGTVINANKTIYQSQIRDSLALVMGSEEKGLRFLIRKNCNELISIPMSGKLSSLNVSVATGICLFEVLRQRKLCLN